MRALLVYVEQDKKLQDAITSLKKYSPQVEIDLVHADKTKTNVAEEEYQKYFNSEKFIDDVIIWHPDMVATEGWYEKLMEDYDKFDLIGCKLIYPDRLVAHYGGAIRMDGMGCHPHQYLVNIGLNEPHSCAFVTGPGMVIKKYVWEKIKSFDFQFSYFIDVDFCFRAREEGFTVGVVPATIIHAEGMDLLKKRTKEETQQLQANGQQRFLGKWMHELSKYR